MISDDVELRRLLGITLFGKGAPVSGSFMVTGLEMPKSSEKFPWRMRFVGTLSRLNVELGQRWPLQENRKKVRFLKIGPEISAFMVWKRFFGFVASKKL